MNTIIFVMLLTSSVVPFTRSQYLSYPNYQAYQPYATLSPYNYAQNPTFSNLYNYGAYAAYTTPSPYAAYGQYNGQYNGQLQTGVWPYVIGQYGYPYAVANRLYKRK